MRQHWYHIKSYISYLFRAKHARGYGIHSPFVFSLVREVIYGREPYYHFDTIKNARSGYQNDLRVINGVDYGSPSKYRKNQTVSHLYHSSSVSHKFGKLLFRMVVHFKPQTILELGTSLGVSTLYLSLPDGRSHVVTIDAHPGRIEKARELFRSLNLNHINVTEGFFDEKLPEVLKGTDELDFVFFDGNHQKDATFKYFQLCLEKAHNDTIFVFDDIYWSQEMTEVWRQIYQHPRVTVSIDLFRMGIVFFRRECQKQHFVVRY